MDGAAQDDDAAGCDRRFDHDRVMRLLWGRLDDAAMRRPKGQDVRKNGDMRARLTRRLAYLTDDNLRTLAEVLIEQGGGLQHDVLPGEAVILGFARGLQREPVTQRRIVTSWLASVEGPGAVAAGYEVALMRWLRTHGRPPLAYDMQQIKSTGVEQRRMVEVIEGRIARDQVTDPDRDWLTAYLADRAEVRRIVDEGAARRVATEVSA